MGWKGKDEESSGESSPRFFSPLHRRFAARFAVGEVRAMEERLRGLYSFYDVDTTFTIQEKREYVIGFLDWRQLQRGNSKAREIKFNLPESSVYPNFAQYQVSLA